MLPSFLLPKTLNAARTIEAGVTATNTTFLTKR